MGDRGAYGAVLLAVVCVSFASLLFRLSDSPALVKAFYRLAIAALILLPIVLLRPAARAALLGLGRRDALAVGVTGFVLAVHFGTWVTSLDLTTVASSTLLVTTHPILVGLVSHFLLRERIHRWVALGIALGLAGTAIIAIGDYGRTGATETLAGDLLAFVGGLMAGLYILAGRRLRRRLELTSYALGVYGVAALFLLLFALVLGPGILPNPGDHGIGVEVALFVALAVVSSIGGHTLYNWALRYLPAATISMSLVGEPLGASLLVLIFLGEVPGPTTLLGAPFILAGIYLAARPGPATAAARPPVQLSRVEP